MLVGWVWLMSVVSHGWASASNVTGVYSSNDKCTNQCDDNDKTHWCGKRRMDPEGFMSRCVQYSRYGRTCVTTCFDDRREKYRWCMTNSVATSSREYWDYCSLQGLTINGEECVDACDTRDEDYYYCHTSSKWDYCSPPGRVKPVQLNIRGSQCKGECGHHGEDYTWCSKNLNYCKSEGKSGTKCDDWWEYCSIDSMHTRYDAQCKDSCSMRGEDYYWCNTVASWDYCSPKAEDGVHISLKAELDIYGNECINLCDTHGYNYFWCKPIGGRSSTWWDYCSKENMTIYNSLCTDSCARRGESFHWCHTASSWDYCSPTKYTAGASGTPAQGAIIILALGMSARRAARNI